MYNNYLKNLIIITGWMLFAASSIYAAPVKSFLPEQAYNPDIPTPEAYLGYQLGEWHVRHDQVIGYFKMLADKSDHLSFEVYGNSWEQKQQVVLIATSKANQQNLAKIKQQRHHPENVQKDAPLVVWLGYSIHGNEASGTNASLAVAYYLAASNDPKLQAQLANSIILVDPSFNPDGYTRFTNWVNANKSLVSNGDNLDRELNEAWPGSRTNHYWFDLNRDWLLAVNPESKNRLNLFHQWHPNILTDHHEMGSNSSYFFQPGVPLRQNPLTPKSNFKLTAKLATFHAKSFDRQKREYFSKEFFDDFYIGKGSTYPDVNGSIGILFEQASVRGHLRQTINGLRNFEFAIKNHVTTSLSTLQGAEKLHLELKTHQRNFYSQQKKSKAAYVFSNKEDPSRSYKLVKFLQQHHIKVYQLKKSVSQKGVTISSGFVVPLNQVHGKLVEAIFDIRTEFKDTTFYDVSAWAMQHAYDLPLMKNTNLAKNSIGSLVKDGAEVKFKSINSAEVIAAVFHWQHENAPKLIVKLMAAGVPIKVNRKPFSIQYKADNSVIEFTPGQITVSLKTKEHKSLLNKLSRKYEISLYPVYSGLSPTGIDLGSPNMRPLATPAVALLTGDGVSSYQAGEARFVIEQKLGMPVTVINTKQLNSENLLQYSHLVLVNGDYKAIDYFSAEENYQPLVNWVKSGGSLIAFENAAKWVTSWKDIQAEMEKTTKKAETEGGVVPRKDFSTKDKMSAINIIGGAIFENDLDASNPIGYGNQDRKIASFKTSTLIFTKTKTAFDSISSYTSKPLLSGYTSKSNLDKIANTPMLVREKLDQGQVILFADDPNFRGYWLATIRLFTNSLFFADID